MPRLKSKTDAARLWQNRHPLRNWIYSQGHPTANRRALETTLDVGRATIYHWLDGTAVPALGRFEAIERLTGITMDQWMRWFHARPKTKEEKP
jgi:hypothetical protein